MLISDWSSDVCSSDLFGEGRVVDVVWQADQAAVRRLAEAAHDGVEESTVGGRVVERLARRIQGRDAALRQQEANRSEERRVGKRVSVRVDLGGRRIINKKNKHINMVTCRSYKQ